MACPAWEALPERVVPADITRKVIKARKPPRHDKVETFRGEKHW